MPIITITKSDSKAIDIWAWLDMQRGLFKSQPLAFMFRHFQLDYTDTCNQIQCKKFRFSIFFSQRTA